MTRTLPKSALSRLIPLLLCMALVACPPPPSRDTGKTEPGSQQIIPSGQPPAETRVSYQDYLRDNVPAEVPRHEAILPWDTSKMELGRLVEAGPGVFSRPVVLGDGFAVIRKVEHTLFATVFDGNWQMQRENVRITPENDKEGDCDVISDGEHVYIFSLVTTAGHRLRKYNADFEMVGDRALPHIEGDQEYVLDQNIELIDGRLYLGAEYRDQNVRIGWPGGNLPPFAESQRGMYTRIFSRNLNPIEVHQLTGTLPGAILPHQFWGMGASQLKIGDQHVVFAASSIGDLSRFDHGESIGARQLFVLRFDKNYQFVDALGPLSDTRHDNYWFTGSWHEDGLTWVAYTFRRKEEGPVIGPPHPDNGNIRLTVFDPDFKEIETIDITRIPLQPGSAAGAHRAKLLKVGDRLYVGYDAASNSYVQEVILK